MASSPVSRKRSVTELLNDEELDSQSRRTRPKLDEKTVTESTTASSSTNSAAAPLEEHASFLAYPNISNSKPSSTPFQQPSQLITFSYTPDHVQEFTNSAMRYFVDPPPSANLSYGYERWIRKSDDRGRIDALLKAISKVTHDIEEQNGTFPEIGVVSWRGVMTKYVAYARFDASIWDINDP